jgi:hypothetical protein
MKQDTEAGARAVVVRLWDAERPLRELAREVVGRKTLSRDNPNENGLIHALNMSSPCVKAALFGPPERVAMSLKKSDVWERRLHLSCPVEPQYKHRMLQSKPSGQIILMADAFAGAGQPEARIRYDCGEVSLGLRKDVARCDLRWLVDMSRENLIALDARGANCRGLAVRLYRHNDVISLPPPRSGQDGRFFWICQNIPAEKTFPGGFECWLVGLVGGPECAMHTVDNQTGLGVPIDFREDWMKDRGENAAPGSAATAVLAAGDGEFAVTAWFTVVTTGDATDPLAEARRRLERAAAQGYEVLLEKNRAWFGALYDRREEGRIFSGDDRDARRLIPFLYRTWTSRHKLSSDPDPARFEEDAYAYNLLNTDYCAWYGLNAYNEEYYTPESVANRSERRMYYYRLAMHWADAWRQRARDVYGAPGMTIAANGYYPPTLADGDHHPNDMFPPHDEYVSLYAYAVNLYVMKNLWDIFDYGGDESFLVEIYPLLRDVADFFAHIVRLGEDGRYHIDPSVNRESARQVVRDAGDCLAAAKWSLRMADEGAGILGKDADRRAVWRERLERMAPYPTVDDPRRDAVISMGLDVIAGIADDIHLDSPVSVKEPALNELGHIEDDPRALWSGMVCYGQLWHLLGRHRDASYTVNGMNPILWRFQVDAWLVDCGSIGLPGQALVSPAQRIDACWYEPERLLNSRNGNMHLFPLVPTGCDVAFRGLQARRGFLVDGEYRGGEAVFLRIRSRRNVQCSFWNPWPGDRVEVRDEAGKEVACRRKGELYRFPARAGVAYRLLHPARAAEGEITNNKRSV